MKVLVLGATGGSGLAAIDALLPAGHDVTAFSRHADRLRRDAGSRLRCLNGDAANPSDVDRAVAGQDAVIVTLGITESALRVRLMGPRTTPMDIRSRGTRNAIAAMRRHGVRKLVVQTTFGVGDTRAKLPLTYRLMFALLLKPQIADTELQDRAVRESGLDWVIAQPVNLTDEPADGAPFASPDGETRTMKVARRQVGRFLAEAVQGDAYLGHTVALSGG